MVERARSETKRAAAANDFIVSISVFISALLNRPVDLRGRVAQPTGARPAGHASRVSAIRSGKRGVHDAVIAIGPKPPFAIRKQHVVGVARKPPGRTSSPQGRNEMRGVGYPTCRLCDFLETSRESEATRKESPAGLAER
jgi:hypothetical protein